MVFFTIFLLLSYIIVYQLHTRNTRKNQLKVLQYRVTFSTNELFESEYFYLEQTLTNLGEEPLPFFKAEVVLPRGMKFVLANDSSIYSQKDDYRQSVQSVFSIDPGCEVTRRWRVIAQKRGIYTTNDVSMVVLGNNPFGSEEYSMSLQSPKGEGTTLTVLPCAKEYFENIALSESYSGTRTTSRGLLQDPMAVCGAREYRIGDPLNRIDWKQTARMGELMVRELEYQMRDSFNVFLNMQTLIIEKNFPSVSDPAYVEAGIRVCASLLDSAIAKDSPVFLVANAPPTSSERCFLWEDEIGQRLFCSEEYRHRDEVMPAYRMLASLPMEISVPIEQVLDDIARRPEQYARGGNLVMVTAYLDARMVRFWEIMRQMGYRVIFFVTTTGQNENVLPEGLEVYYRICNEKEGLGFAS